MNYSSSCRCGKIKVDISLPKNIEGYEPRACDCDFCTEREASYLSDPNGELTIYHSDKLDSSRQGSEQALFWQCSFCKDLVAVSCEIDSHLKGAVNARLFDGHYDLKPPVSVSPKTLTPKEKLARWNIAWLKVTFRD